MKTSRKDLLYISTLTAMVIGMIFLTFPTKEAYSQVPSESIVSFDSHPQLGIVAIVFNGQETKLVSIEKEDKELKYIPFPVQMDSISNICIVEITGDKKPDILVKKFSFIEETHAQLFYSKNVGKGKWAEFKLFQIQPVKTVDNQYGKLYPIDVTSGDINHDKKPDLMFILNTEGMQTESIMLYSLNRGKGRFTEPQSFPVQEGKAYRIAIGDVTLDGKQDILIVTHKGWVSNTRGEYQYITEPALNLIENKGNMDFEKSRGIIKIIDFAKSFEDIAYDNKTCIDEPHLFLLFKDHPFHGTNDPGKLVFLNSDEPVVKPTFVKGKITWPTGITKRYEKYKLSTPWEWEYPGREREVLIDY